MRVALSISLTVRLVALGFALGIILGLWVGIEGTSGIGRREVPQAPMITPTAPPLPNPAAAP